MSENSNQQQNIWMDLAEYARWAPSPHNTQPCRLKIINDDEAAVYFVRDRGLSVGDPMGRFTFLTFGIFVEILAIAASHHGYKLEYEYIDEPLYKDDEPLQRVASLKLVKGANPDVLGIDLIKKRKTSRLPYDSTPVPEAAIGDLQKEVSKFGHNISFRTDQEAIDYVVDLNKDSFFYDLEHESFRKELRSWLRYSHKHAEETKDGLSAETMHISGRLIHSIMFHSWIYMNPIIKPIIQKIYVSTMKGISTVAWIQGPYKNQQDWIKSGHLMIRLWLIMTKHDLYWQPYGSIITNDESRAKMIKQFKISDEDNNNNAVWLLLRLGYSDEPPRSERLPLEEIVI